MYTENCSIKIVNKIIALLVILTVLTSATVFAKPWDGYQGEEQTKVSLVNFNSIKSIKSTGAKISKEHKDASSMYSAYWANHESNPDFWITSFDSSVPSDWTNYTCVNMDVWSAKATGAEILVVITSPNSPEGMRYYNTRFKVDWQGHKTISIKFDSLSEVRSPTWSNINGFRLVGHGNWDIVGHPETELYISSLTLGGATSGYNFITGFYDENTIDEAFSSMESSVALYAGSEKIVTSAGADTACAKSYLDGKTVMIPLEILTDYFDVEADVNGNDISIRTGEIELKASLGSKIINVNSEAYELDAAPCIKDGVCYIPGEEISRNLGKESFTDGNLIVIGTKEAYESLRRPGNRGVNEKNEIISYTLYSPELNPEDYSAVDCNAVLNNWRRHLVGDEVVNDLTDPDIKKRIDAIEQSSETARLNLIKENADKELFKDSKSIASADMTTDYKRVEAMAKAYAAYGSKYYKDESLKADILYALDWLKTNRYSHNGKSSFVITGLDDWHDWDVGVPECIIHTLICLGDSISQMQIKNYLSYYDETNPNPISAGANYCHMAQLAIGSALLQRNVEKSLTTIVELNKEYLYVDDNERNVESYLAPRDYEVQTKGSGFFTDGSYVYHTLHAMNSSYGLKHYTAIMQIEKLLNGTKFDFNTAFKENLDDFYFDTFDPVTFGTATYRSVLGRACVGTNSTGGIQHLANAFVLSQVTDDENLRNRIYSVIKSAYNNQSEQVKAMFLNMLSLDDIVKFKNIMTDESILPRENRRDSKVFYNMDKSVHNRDDWGFSVSMSSSRIFNYESINGENLNGWYVGDGRTEYLIENSDMGATNQYWSSMDPYRLPGTTVDNQPRMEVSVNQGNEYLSSEDFVGGVEMNGEYSASAMALESYNSDIEFGVASAYGGKNPIHQNDLKAQKSYFMLDDGVICLGSKINAKNNNNAEVITVVDNPLSSTTVTVSDNSTTPYEILSAVANQTPEAENTASNTIDDSRLTKWAGAGGGEIVWDIGSPKPLGFVNLSLLYGNQRQQYFELQISSDGLAWESVFSGASSGTKDVDEPFDLKGKTARYLKYINNGNSNGSAWVSINDCSIYPPNADGTIGTVEAEIYGADPIYADGEAISVLGSDINLENVSWVNFNNKVGYYFPENSALNPGELKCRWTKNALSHFELWFSHGINPTDGGYAYVILPSMTSESTANFAASKGITVLKNDNDIHAARDNRTGITYIVFWNPGQIAGVTASQPCMVIMKETEECVNVAVSDPTQKLKEGTVVIDKTLSVIKSDEYASVTQSNTNTTISLNFADSVGRSYSFEFRK